MTKINLTDKQKELFKKVQEIFGEIPIYLVGGAVRDLLMCIEPHDYDFCIANDPESNSRSIKSSGRHVYEVGKRFGTVGCKIDGQMIEITTFRSEQYEPGSRKPEVKFVTTITEDLSRRDFTINAMALRLDNLRLIDPFKGRDDIQNKIIRTVGSPKMRFKEDPLRILRAIRFATRFDYEIESKTYKKMQHMAIHISDISKERWMQEMDKILASKNVSVGLNLLWETKLFNYMIPELSLQYNYNQNSQYHNFKLHEHTIKVVNSCPIDIDLNLRWAALLHDIAKPFVRTDKEKFVDKEIDGRIIKNVPIIKSNYIGHEILGAEMAKRIAQHLKWSKERTESVVSLIRHHLEDACELRKYDNGGKK